MNPRFRRGGRAEIPHRAPICDARRRTMDPQQRLFCPKCGEPMTLVDGTFECLAGKMPLSRALHTALCEVFVDRSRDARAIAVNWGGDWFCPRCGGRAETADRHVRCLACGQYLDEFLYPLVELHPHGGG